MLSLVAQQHGLPLGFCAVGHKVGGRIGLLAILVEPSYQRQGTGTALIAALQSALRLEGIKQLALGSGSANGYFWPGVPVSEDAAWPFFRKHGWKEKERSFDLLLDLSDYRTPSWVCSRLAESGIELRLADLPLRPIIMRFERSWFPHWAMFFEEALDRSDYENVLVAHALDGSIAAPF
jgi:ribosomal protein S18 acetylase RimI-like enzyme